MKKNSFIHHLHKNKNSIAIINGSEKISYLDIVMFKEKHFKCKQKVFLLFSSDYFETIFLYSALLISDNIIILVDFIKDKNYINLLIKNINQIMFFYPKLKLINLTSKKKKYFL